MNWNTEPKYTEALAYIDRPLEENGNFTLAFMTRAGILNAPGRYPEAVEAADQVIVLDLPRLMHGTTELLPSTK